MIEINKGWVIHPYMADNPKKSWVISKLGTNEKSRNKNNIAL